MDDKISYERNGLYPLVLKKTVSRTWILANLDSLMQWDLFQLIPVKIQAWEERWTFWRPMLESRELEDCDVVVDPRAHALFKKIELNVRASWCLVCHVSVIHV